MLLGQVLMLAPAIILLRKYCRLSTALCAAVRELPTEMGPGCRMLTMPKCQVDPHPLFHGAAAQPEQCV